MKLFFLIIPMVFLSGCTQLSPGQEVYACESTADCVPASCCHADEAVNVKYAPDCHDELCTQGCSGPLDCGRGLIACEDHVCVIKSRGVSS